MWECAAERKVCVAGVFGPGRCVDAGVEAQVLPTFGRSVAKATSLQHRTRASRMNCQKHDFACEQDLDSPSG